MQSQNSDGETRNGETRNGETRNGSSPQNPPKRDENRQDDQQRNAQHDDRQQRNEGQRGDQQRNRQRRDGQRRDAHQRGGHQRDGQRRNQRRGGPQQRNGHQGSGQRRNSQSRNSDDSGKTYYRIKILHSSETQICGWHGEELHPDTQVVVNSRYGRDVGKILGPLCGGCGRDRNGTTDIIRVATSRDKETFEKNIRREKDAMATCRQMVKDHGLDMKLVSAHFLDEDSKLLFFFTADERVDFRSLVKDLVSVFKMRIELRQIGVRDESRVLGGLAVCGRSYCCHGITDKLKPVSIKMAKEQNLSLNSMKISGPCGRLLCCLSYEYDFYREEKGQLPSEGSRLKIGDGNYRVQEVNILSKMIRLSSQEGGYRDLPFSCFSRDQQSNRWVVEDLPEE